MSEPATSDSPNDSPAPTEPGWPFCASSQRLLWTILWIFCGGSLLAELLLAPHRHGHFEVDASPGFYGLLGFVMCTFLIFFAKYLGMVLKVKPDFYEKRED